MPNKIERTKLNSPLSDWLSCSCRWLSCSTTAATKYHPVYSDQLHHQIVPLAAAQLSRIQADGEELPGGQHDGVGIRSDAADNRVCGDQQAQGGSDYIG